MAPRVKIRIGAPALGGPQAIRFGLGAVPPRADAAQNPDSTEQPWSIAPPSYHVDAHRLKDEANFALQPWTTRKFGPPARGSRSAAVGRRAGFAEGGRKSTP